MAEIYKIIKISKQQEYINYTTLTSNTCYRLNQSHNTEHRPLQIPLMLSVGHFNHLMLHGVNGSYFHHIFQYSVTRLMALSSWPD